MALYHKIWHVPAQITQKQMTFSLFIELKIAQHRRKGAETWYNSERFRLRIGCKPIYLQVILLMQTQTQPCRLVYMNRSETLHFILSDITSIVAVTSLGVNEPLGTVYGERSGKRNFFWSDVIAMVLSSVFGFKFPEMLDICGWMQFMNS